MTGNAAHKFPLACGGNGALHMELANHSLLGQIPEKAHIRAGVGHVKTLDVIAVALKGAAEGGNALKGNAGQIQIPVQLHRQTLAVGIQTAILGKTEKILHAAKGQNGFLSSCAQGQRCQQAQTQYDTNELTHGRHLLPWFLPPV